MKDEPHGNDIEHLRAIVEPTATDPYYDFRKGKAVTDIVERLRDGSFSVDLCREAADEIERMRTVLQEIANMRYSNTSAATIAYEASRPDFASLAVAFGNPKAPTDE